MPTRWTLGSSRQEAGRVLLPEYSVSSTVSLSECRQWPALLAAQGARLESQLPPGELDRVGAATGQYFNCLQIMLYRGKRRWSFFVKAGPWHVSATGQPRVCCSDHRALRQDDGETQNEDHGYEEGTFIGSISLGGDIYMQFGDDQYNEAANSSATNGTGWCSTWRLQPGSAFVFSAADDKVGKHRATRHIEKKKEGMKKGNGTPVTPDMAEAWAPHAALPDTDHDEDRYALVYRRMPAKAFREFAAEFPHRLVQ